MKRRIWALVLGLFLVFSQFSPMATAETIATVVTASGTGAVNLRRGPGNYTVITALPVGTSVGIINKNGNWYRIKVLSNGRVGYMYKDYVSVGGNRASTNLAAKIGLTGTTGTIKGSGAVLRSSASASGKQITKLGSGTRLILRGSTGNWYKVTAIRTTKVTGYVLKSQVARGVKGTMTSGANMREGGSTSFKKIMMITSGSSVTILSIGSSWSKVRYGNTTGFVSNLYLALK